MLILLILGVGVMFRLVSPAKVFWFIILLMILPLVTGTASQAFAAVFSPQSSWLTWVLGFLGILIAIRLFLDRLCHKHRR